MSYTRIEDGLEIEWKPDDETLGSKAVENIIGETGSPEVDDQTAKEIRKEYQNLLDQKSSE